MTVFNYFPRKEDLFFDREDEGRMLAEEALLDRGEGVAPINALHALIHRLAEERHPFAWFDIRTARFRRTMNASPALSARAREILDELARDIARMLAREAGERAARPRTRLAASMLVAAWSVAQEEGHGTFSRSGRSDAARAAFLSVIDSAFAAARVIDGTAT
ncbi:TetR family transcriptional regulator [Methylopila sp. Yamaguchi]|uniref:TetR family transcriptional regulator n=1 Tax=Methylopila sp. Yamaguchi TaxID=1437817 RepID=UPI000CC96704|nr:TetR family transcriptional regulator [Methylopila sp. Yamaguchi]GBD46848.1 TetR family transcriptional regulator [Methylopila sp. Yamaguchi]